MTLQTDTQILCICIDYKDIIFLPQTGNKTPKPKRKLQPRYFSNN